MNDNEGNILQDEAMKIARKLAAENGYDITSIEGERFEGEGFNQGGLSFATNAVTCETIEVYDDGTAALL